MSSSGASGRDTVWAPKVTRAGLAPINSGGGDTASPSTVMVTDTWWPSNRHDQASPLADREADRIAGGELYFAWEGPALPGSRHYYRVQGDDLLIEYDNTDDGNHAHTVLRRPLSDFGDDILAAHYGEEHAS